MCWMKPAVYKYKSIANRNVWVSSTDKHISLQKRIVHCSTNDMQETLVKYYRTTPSNTAKMMYMFFVLSYIFFIRHSIIWKFLICIPVRMTKKTPCITLWNSTGKFIPPLNNHILPETNYFSPHPPKYFERTAQRHCKTNDNVPNVTFEIC